ncbi:hypothetical protein GCM10010103_56880 [Streptomyces paradoxus]
MAEKPGVITGAGDADRIRYAPMSRLHAVEAIGGTHPAPPTTRAPTAWANATPAVTPHFHHGPYTS